jgi:DNA-binding CsgD family transcriptional regulator
MSTTTKVKVPTGCPLSQREYETMNWIATGCTYKQAAYYMNIGESTVRSHVHKSLGKLGVPDSKQAIVVMVKRGWYFNVLDQDDKPLPPFAHLNGP